MSKWTTVSFNDALIDTTGGQPKIQRRHYRPAGILPIIDQGQTEVAGYTNDPTTAYQGPLPVILFGDHTRAFKIAFRPFALGADGVKVLSPKRGFDPEFLLHYLRSRHLPTLGYSRHFKLLKGISVPQPPLAEQRHIVDILNRAYGIRRLRREALAKARQLIPALFVEMFGDPLDCQRQWPKKVLGDLVAAFEGGKNLQAGSEHGPFRILKVSAVTWGDFRPKESKSAPEDHAPPKHHFVRDGDLLFSRANTEELVGATVLVRNPPANLLLPDKLWRVVWREPSEVISLYALGYFQHPSTRRAMGNLATGTSASMRNISQAKLRTLKMPVPPLSLQRAYAARVNDIQSVIAEQQRAAAAANQLVASLMARFFDDSPK